MRRWTVWLFLAWAGCAAARLPNIVLIVADDLGWGDVGFNGQLHIRTPHLDQLAAEGLVFTQHYAGSSLGMPSRACLLTGRDTGTGRIRGNPGWSASGEPVDLAREDVTIAEELKQAGYRTAIIGRWGLAEGRAPAGLPWNQGFDTFYGFLRRAEAMRRYPAYLWRDRRQVPLPENQPEEALGTYAPDLIAAEAVRFLAEAEAEKPFFLLFAPTLPAYELTVPEESKDPYRALGWPERRMERGAYRHDPDGNLSYAGMVSRLDETVGRLIATLRERGLEGETLVLFTSDNGPEFERAGGWFASAGPFRGGKRDLTEGGIRVPLVAWWPGRIQPGQTGQISAGWDLLPTLCAIAGRRPTEEDLRGISLLPTLVGQPGAQRPHPFLYWEINEREGPIQALRVGDWKLLVRDEAGPELYNLAADPGESHDLAATDRGRVQHLLGLLAAARTSSPEYPLLRRSGAAPAR